MISAPDLKEQADLTISTLRPCDLFRGFNAWAFFVLAKLVSSKPEACRLVEQGGAFVNGERIEDPFTPVSSRDLVDDCLVIRAGRHRHIFLVSPAPVRSYNMPPGGRLDDPIPTCPLDMGTPPSV